MKTTLSLGAVVMTTIGDAGEFLEAYRRAMESSPPYPVRLIVIPDRKSPADLYVNCAKARSAGMDVVCPTMEEQAALFTRLGVPTLVPVDSDNRRNVGYLMALQAEADLVISTDDDNLPVSPTFFADHAAVVQGPGQVTEVGTESGFYNPCDRLAINPMGIYPRGFPYFARRSAAVRKSSEIADVRINAGLWLDDPDVDAITRIAVRPAVTGMTGESAVLAPDTWAPVNSQNTAIHRDAVPAYYFPRMGYRHQGQPIDRFADIFSGYFVHACAKHLGHAVRFGAPLVEHRRNEHQLLTDLRQELSAIEALEDLLAWLPDCSLDGGGYEAAYLSLSYELQDAVEEMRGSVWTQELRGFLHQMAHLMRQWLRAVAAITGTALA